MVSSIYGEFIIGQSFWITAKTYNEAGALADPLTVTFKTRDSAGTLTTFVFGVAPQLEKVAVGHYRMLFIQALTEWHDAEIKVTGGQIDDAARLRWKGLPALA